MYHAGQRSFYFRKFEIHLRSTIDRRLGGNEYRRGVSIFAFEQFCPGWFPLYTKFLIEKHISTTTMADDGRVVVVSYVPSSKMVLFSSVQLTERSICETWQY